MMGGWWQMWGQARLMLLVVHSHGACSLLGDVGRAHSSGMMGGWWQKWSQTRLMLRVVRSQLRMLTFRLLPLTV